jgi:hypothetical protein
MDVTMLEIGNARERDLDQWKALFAETDHRFVCKGMEQPPGSLLSMLEVIWQE